MFKVNKKNTRIVNVVVVNVEYISHPFSSVSIVEKVNTSWASLILRSLYY